MDIAAYFSLLLVLSYLLVKSADLIEDAFVLIAKRLRVSTFLIGFLILAAASSLPEISVAVSSAIEQRPDLSVGNLIGASFTILTLIIALNALYHKRLPFHGKFGVWQMFMALMLLSLQIITLMDQRLSIEEGYILLASYTVFIFYIAEHLRKRRGRRPESTVQVAKIWNLMIRSVIGLVGILVLSRLIVDAAIRFADLIHVPESIIGLVVLALGTNITEITLLVRSRNAEQEKLAVGGFIGSACLNTGALGLLGILAPHQIADFTAIIPSLLLFIAAIILFALFAWSDQEITRREGFLLLFLYVVFLAIGIGMIFGVI